MEIMTLIDILKYMNIKMLRITLKHTIHVSSECQKKYNCGVRFLRKCIQKYCNDMYVTINFDRINYNCDFWNDCKCVKYHNSLIDIFDDCTRCTRLKCAIIDDTKPNIHRNFKLETRRITHNK